MPRSPWGWQNLNLFNNFNVFFPIQLSYIMYPFSLSCEQCILQWTYTAGNNWGICDDGSGALGCGPQVIIVDYDVLIGQEL